jgi:hypothetical protein
MQNPVSLPPVGERKFHIRISKRNTTPEDNKNAGRFPEETACVARL